MYAFGVGYTIDLPTLIMDQMMLTVKTKKASLLFELCRIKGVIADPTWPTMEHLAPLDKTLLKKIHRGQAEEQLEAPPEPQADPFLKGADF